MTFHLPVDISGHPEVTDFGYSTCPSAGQKAIPCSYISVYEMILFQIFTATGDISSYVQQVLHR